MLEREYTIPECKVIFTDGRFTEQAQAHHKAIPLVRQMDPEPPKREIIALRYAERPRRQRPAVIPRDVPEKPKKVAAPKPPPAPVVVAPPKPKRMERFSDSVRRWLRDGGYRYCFAGKHAVCSDAYTAGSRCKVCNRVRCEKWRAANPEKVIASVKAYRANHPEMQKAATAKWQSMNRERRNTQQKRWYDTMRADPVRWAARLAADLKRKALKHTPK